MADDVSSTVSDAVSSVTAWYKNLSVWAAGGVGVGIGFVLGLLF